MGSMVIQASTVVFFALVVGAITVVSVLVMALFIVETGFEGDNLAHGSFLDGCWLIMTAVKQLLLSRLQGVLGTRSLWWLTII